MFHKKLKLLAMAFIFALLPLCNASAADWPTKPITLISPFGAGGDSDLTARVWAEFAKPELGQPVIVVNKTGGGGVVGSLFAAKAKPDGYTLFLAQAGPNIIIPMTAKGADYGFESFDYISRIMMANCAVVAKPDSPWKNLKEFAEATHKAPGKLIFASPSANSWLTFAMRNWFEQAGVKVKIVEYKSGGEAATAVMGGHADMTFLFPQNYSAMAQAGKLKILAIGFKSDTFKNAPTFEELGYPGNYYGWAGIAAPKGTPAAILEKLTEVSKKVVNTPGYVKAIENMGATPNFETGPEWMKQLKEQYAEMEKVLTSLGLNNRNK